MSGFIKKNNERKYPINSSKNIEHKGLRLYEVIEILKKNIINLFSINQVSRFGISIKKDEK